MPAGPSADWRHWSAIILLGFIWGGAFLSTRIALEGFGPLWVATGRAVIAAAVLLPLAWATGQLRGLLRPRVLAHVVAFGVIAVAFALSALAWGQQHVPSAFAGAAMGAVPLLVLPLAAVFSPEEAINRWKVAGVLLGFAGIATLAGPEALRPLGADLEPLGRLACIACAAGYAVGSIITRGAPPVGPLGFSAASLAVGALILLPLALLAEGAPELPPPRPALALLWAGVGPTALGAVIRFLVIRSAGSVFMSLTSYMVPLWAVLLGWAVLGEPLDPGTLGGLALILTGIATTQIAPRGRPSV